MCCGKYHRALRKVKLLNKLVLKWFWCCQVHFQLFDLVIGGISWWDFFLIASVHKMFHSPIFLMFYCSLIIKFLKPKNESNHIFTGHFKMFLSIYRVNQISNQSNVSYL